MRCKISPPNKCVNVSYFLRPEIGSGGSVADSANLETTQEYYLLENLAASLLCQRSDDHGTYSSELVESYSTCKDQITLILKWDNKWSDGTPITCLDVVESLRSAVSRNARHLVALRDAIISSSGTREIKISQPELCVEVALHELSLADTAILKRIDGVDTFNVTSGAYFVSSVDPKNWVVELTRNPFFGPAASGPNSVRLLHAPFLAQNGVEIAPGTQIDGLGTINFFPPQGWGFLPFTSRAIQRSHQKVEGEFSMIHFLYFKSGNVEMLKDLAIFLAKKRILTAPPAGTKKENQIIPMGYHGRIQNYSSPPGGVRQDMVKVYLDLLPGHKQIASYFESLLGSNSGTGFRVEIVSREEADIVLGSSSFKGNRSDPTSTFSFLLAPPGGLLSGSAIELLEHFRKNYCNQEFGEILHRTLLDDGWVVPLFVERMYFLFDDQWTVDGYDPFDLRVRFCDLRNIQSEGIQDSVSN